MNATADQTKSLEWLNRLRANPKIPLIVAGSAAVAVMVALILWAKTPDYRTLFSNLSDQDGGAIVSQLTQMNIPYRFSEASGAIEVPADKVHELRLRLVAGAPDPADAALRYGQANALLGAIWQPVTRVFHVKDGWARVEVDFERTEPALYGRVSLSLTVGELAALGLSFGVKALSVLLAVRREDRQRTGQKQNAAV